MPDAEMIDSSTAPDSHAGEACFAEAGGQYPRLLLVHKVKSWIPAFAGMTWSVSPGGQSFRFLVQQTKIPRRRVAHAMASRTTT